MKRLSITVVVAFLAVQGSWAVEEPLSIDVCHKAIGSKIPKWTPSPPPHDLAVYAKEQKFETNVKRADFDSDGFEDIALLINSFTEGDKSQYIAVCLARKKRTELHLIKDPYCGDGIEVSLKGKEFHNYVTDKTEKYTSNGISAYCFEKAGGTYLYKNGEFHLVVDSD